jgi:hypothetical protein
MLRLQILELKVRHKEFYPEGQWVKICNAEDHVALTQEGDENIYHYTDDDLDYAKVKVGDIIMLDDDMEVLEIGQLYDVPEEWINKTGVDWA